MLDFDFKSRSMIVLSKILISFILPALVIATQNRLPENVADLIERIHGEESVKLVSLVWYVENDTLRFTPEMLDDWGTHFVFNDTVKMEDWFIQVFSHPEIFYGTFKDYFDEFGDVLKPRLKRDFESFLSNPSEPYPELLLLHQYVDLLAPEIFLEPRDFVKGVHAFRFHIWFLKYNEILKELFKIHFPDEMTFLSKALREEVIIEGLFERGIRTMEAFVKRINTAEFKDRLYLAIALVKYFSNIQKKLLGRFTSFKDAFKVISSQYGSNGGILKEIMPIEGLSKLNVFEGDIGVFTGFMIRKVEKFFHFEEVIDSPNFFIKEISFFLPFFNKDPSLRKFYLIAIDDDPISKAIQMDNQKFWDKMSQEFGIHWKDIVRKVNLFNNCIDPNCFADKLPDLQMNVLETIKEEDKNLLKDTLIDSISEFLKVDSLQHLNSLTFRELKSLEKTVSNHEEYVADVLSNPHIFDDPSIVLNKRIIPWAIKDFVAKKLYEFGMKSKKSKNEHVFLLSTIVRYMSAKELLEEIKQMQFEDSEDVWGQIKVSLSKYFDSKPSIEKISLLLKGIGEEDKSFRDTSIRLSKVGHSTDVAIIEKDGKFMFQESFCLVISIVQCYRKLNIATKEFKDDDFISQSMEIKLRASEPQIKWDPKLITDPKHPKCVPNYNIIEGKIRVPSNYDDPNEGKAFDFTFWRYIHASKEATDKIDEHVIFINGGPGGFGHTYEGAMNQMADIKKKTIAFYVFDHRGLGESGQFHPHDPKLDWEQIQKYIDNLFNRELFPFPFKDLNHQNAAFDLGMFSEAIRNDVESSLSNVKISLIGFSYGSLLANQAVYEFPNRFDKIMIGGVPGSRRHMASSKGMMDVCQETEECVKLLGGNLDARMEEAIKGLLFNYTKNECQEGFLKAFQSKPANLSEFGIKIKPLLDFSVVTGLAAIILSLECNDDYKGAYLDKLPDIKSLLHSKQTFATGLSGLDQFVLHIVNRNMAHSYLDEWSMGALPFHNRWYYRILESNAMIIQRTYLDSELVGVPVTIKAARSSVTPVFQLQSMLDLVTPYIEAGETFEAMKVPLKVSLLFRNYGHTVPTCDAMREYFLKWLSLPRNTIVGKRVLFNQLAKACDALKVIPWVDKIREFFPEHYIANPQGWESNYVSPSFFDCKREMLLADGKRGEIDCSVPMIGMHRMAAYQIGMAY